MRENFAQIAESMVDAIQRRELDNAEALWFQLRDLPEVPPEVLASGAFILLERGQPLDALHYLDTLPQDCCPDLKALCTYQMGDPIWHLQASELEDSADPLVRVAMRQLLGKPELV